MKAIGDAIVLAHRNGTKYVYVKAFPAASTTRKTVATDIENQIDLSKYDEGDIVADVEISELLDEPDYEIKMRA